MNWTPPRERPASESAGYLGYYARTFLRQVFDLIDLDGTWPAVWGYWKAERSVFRFIEEKPDHQDQGLHSSQWRLYPALARIIDLAIAKGVCAEGSGVYVIWSAERLAIPAFPVKVSKVGAHGAFEKSMHLSRSDFDEWLLTGELLPKEKAA